MGAFRAERAVAPSGAGRGGMPSGLSRRVATQAASRKREQSQLAAGRAGACPRKQVPASAVAAGGKYLDLLAGIATCALGHCHPETVAALKAQAEKLWHVSNVFYSGPSIELADQLSRHSGLPRVFFCNSGGEANEALIKLTRK